MLSPDDEARMLFATHLHGDASLEGFRNQVAKVAWRVDSLSDHATRPRPAGRGLSVPTPAAVV
jgi:hypothetical protein